MDESGWMCMKVDEVNEIGWKDENGWSGWKLMKVDESLLNGWKWIKDDESGWKLMKLMLSDARTVIFVSLSHFQFSCSNLHQKSHH